MSVRQLVDDVLTDLTHQIVAHGDSHVLGGARPGPPEHLQHAAQRAADTTAVNRGVAGRSLQLAGLRLELGLFVRAEPERRRDLVDQGGELPDLRDVDRVASWSA